MKKKMLSAALLLAALLCLSAAAAEESGDETAITAANEWQYSDVRKYLNNSVTDGQADSTTEWCNSTNDSGYAAHFTDAEYDLMQPTKVDTLKDVNHVDDPNSLVTTTDRIFLPSGRSENDGMNVLSWGEKDLAYKDEPDKNVLIPLGYWAASDSGRLWLRSAGTDPNEAMSYQRTKSVDQSKNVSTALGVAPVFRLNAENILFASCASAADLAGRTPQSIEIKKSEYLGNITDRAEDNNSITSPTYGMYLKTAYTGKNFRVRNLSYSENEKELSFEYAGGMPGDYVMIQAYEKDDFAPIGDDAVRGYVAAMLIGDGRGEMSVDMTENLKQNTADYTFKIWMENPSRVSLAQATVPQTFLFDGVSFEEVDDDEDPHKNLRMFAMKHELDCSWGDLSNSDDVVKGGTNSSGNDGDSWIKGKSCGLNPSNQIIYFGVESYSKEGSGVVSKPLRFWIAGTGSTTINGKTVPTLTLYQMSSDETHVFRGNGPYSPGNSLAFTTQIDPDQNGLKKGSTLSVNPPENQSYRLISTNPHVAAVEQDGTVTIQGYGEFSIVLFSGDQILQTQTIRVADPDLKGYDYNPAGEWSDDETEEDEEQPEQQPEQPEQPEEAVQDAADGLPQTGDSSAALLWAALLALSLAGLAARRRRSA